MFFRILYDEQIKIAVFNPHAKSLTTAKPLLRSPFGRTAGSAISFSKLSWTPASPVKEANRNIASQIISARIGGAFWKPELPLPKSTFEVIVLPPNLRAASKFWRQVLFYKFADDLLVLVPHGSGFAALAKQISATGALVAQAGNPHAVLDIARSVHATTASDLTIIAELAARPVFYHQSDAPLAALVGHAAAWVTEGTDYRNPYTGAYATCAETVELLTDWQRSFARNRSIASCAGMSMWKQHRIRQLLYTGEAAPPFSRTAKAAVRAATDGEGAIAVWSTRMPKGLVGAAECRNIVLHRVEDGFIRGAGLGSNLALPASIIVDQRGIYFDPSRPSDLEHCIASTEFSSDLILRAKRLIALLLAGGISKYGAGGRPPVLKSTSGQRIILVPGQVADDLSVQLGACGSVRNNRALLAAVRAGNPDAFIVYRPHPDVVAGHRYGAIADPVATGLADQVTHEGAIAALLERVDEVHTITSLTGFEALLRGCVVETYGQPFYSSWGLTKDHAPLARRQRRISIEELVAATLILYPLYVDPLTGLPCGPEMLISRLGQPELWRPRPLMQLTRLQGQIRNIWRQAWTGRKLQNA